MRKLGAIAVLFAWIPFCGKPLCGQPERQPRHEEKPANAITNKPQSEYRGTKESPIFVYVEQYPQSKADAAKAEKEQETKEFNDRLVAWSAVGAAGFTGLLVIIGCAGVFAAVRTLRGIERQGDLMDRQTTLMEAQLRQWIEIDGWAAEGIYDEDRIKVRCHVLNPTGLPITITRIESGGSFITSPYPAGTQLPLSPRSRYLFQFPMLRLTAQEIEAFDANRLLFPVVLAIDYEDAFKRALSRQLSFQCTCGITRECEVEALLSWTTHPTEIDKTKPKDTGQSPN